MLMKVEKRGKCPYALGHRFFFPLFKNREFTALKQPRYFPDPIPTIQLFLPAKEA
jgi:hypothetical protein